MKLRRLTVAGDNAARGICLVMIKRSAPFSIEPLPDGAWRFELKDEHFMAAVNAERCDGNRDAAFEAMWEALRYSVTWQDGTQRATDSSAERIFTKKARAALALADKVKP